MRIIKLFKSQRGDTIIEVMLAMSVIGLVLGSSYAIANRSLSIGREAQERTEALKVVETQLERLRTASAIEGSGLVDFPTTSAFCVDNTIDVVDFARPNFDSFTETTIDEVQYPENPDGDRPCNQGTDGRYGITITKSDAEDTYLYTIRARWEAIGGGPLRELTTQYRIYPSGNTAFEALLPPPIDPSTLCSDPTADNIGDRLPCEFPEPVVDPLAIEPIEFDIGQATARFSVQTNGEPTTYVATISGASSMRTITNTTGIFSLIGLLPETEYEVVVTASNGIESAEGSGRFTTEVPSGLTRVGEFDNSVYYLSNSTATWVQAASAARANEGFLTTVASTAENTRVSGFAGGNWVWIGLNDAAQEGIYEWQSGEASSYTNYQAPPQPDNWSGGGVNGEDYIHLMPDRSGMWNDLNETSRLRFMVEYRSGISSYNIPTNIPVRPPVFFGGSQYYISSGRHTWSEANAFAESSGGHLVTISSAAENARISSLASGRFVWIGLSDRNSEGVWRWENDENSPYRNWAPSEPNDYLNGVPGEDVAVLNWSGGQWNDWFNDDVSRAFFVIEYDE